MGDELKSKMLKALTWTSVDRFGQQLIQLVITLILSRLLSPDEFGLLGLVMIYMTLSYVLIESGFTQSLIRKSDANETDYNTVFYFNIGVSLLLYWILFLTVPNIASLFRQPQLVPIGRVVFLAIIFNAFCLVPSTKLTKELDFKTIAKINILSIFISGTVGVTLAFLRFGVWSLVAQQVLFNFSRMVNFQIFVKWKPRMIFKFEVIRNFWSFSINLLGTSILNVIFNNLYVQLLGLYYPLKQVGYYNQGNKLSETFNYTFQSILTASTYPLFAKIQDDDERFRRVFRGISRKVSIITFPVMVVLIFVAKPFVAVLLTSKFIPSVPYFQLLLLAALFAPLYALNITALNSRGKSKLTFRIEILKKTGILISVIVCFKFGFITMLWGYAIVSFFAFLVSTYYLKKDLTHYIKHQILDFVECIVAGLVIAFACYGLSFLIANQQVLLASQLCLSAILYFSIIYLFFNSIYVEFHKMAIEKAQDLLSFLNDVKLFKLK